MLGFLFVGIGRCVRGNAPVMLISLIPYKQEFPLLTLIINILGALLIGYIPWTCVKERYSSKFKSVFKNRFMRRLYDFFDFFFGGV